MDIDKPDNRAARFELRFTPTELETVRQRAAAQRQSVSAFVRDQVLKREISSITDESMVFELRRLGRLFKHLYPTSPVGWTAEQRHEYTLVMHQLRDLANKIDKQMGK